MSGKPIPDEVVAHVCDRMLTAAIGKDWRKRAQEAVTAFWMGEVREALQEVVPALTAAQQQGQAVAWFPANAQGEIIRTYGDGSPVYACRTKEEAEQAKRCHLGATGPVIPLYAAPPPSAPVGVEGFDEWYDSVDARFWDNWDACNAAFHAGKRAALATLQAEIEALRAEVEMLRDAFSDEDMTAGAHWFGRYVEQKRRAERLAEEVEALRAEVAVVKESLTTELRLARGERDRAMQACETIAGHLAQAEARAERLAEALRAERRWWVDRKADAIREQVGGLTRGDPGAIARCDAAIQRINAALDQARGKGGGEVGP